MSEKEIEAEIQAKGKTAPRITPEHIDAQIHSEHYLTGTNVLFDCIAPQSAAKYSPTTEYAMGCLTICVLVLQNGFTLVGKSACASPANFDAEIGRKLAREDARRQLWPLEGYQLRTQLSRPAVIADPAVLSDNEPAT